MTLSFKTCQVGKTCKIETPPTTGLSDKQHVAIYVEVESDAPLQQMIIYVHYFHFKFSFIHIDRLSATFHDCNLTYSQIDAFKIRGVHQNIKFINSHFKFSAKYLRYPITIYGYKLVIFDRCMFYTSESDRQGEIMMTEFSVYFCTYILMRNCLITKLQELSLVVRKSQTLLTENLILSRVSVSQSNRYPGVFILRKVKAVEIKHSVFKSVFEQV